jgi:fatty acid desaturase
MHEDMWATPPDPTRDRHSAFTGMAPPTGPPLPVVSPPPSYLVFGILTTIFCFLPFGIVSIVKGSSVAALWAQGRYDEAHRASRAARNWAIAAVVALPVVAVLFMTFLFSMLVLTFS